MTTALTGTSHDDLVQLVRRGSFGPDPADLRIAVAFTTRQAVRHEGRGTGYRNEVLSLRLAEAVGSCAVEPGHLPDSAVEECVGADVARLLEHPLLPVRVANRDQAGHELEFILRSLVELKLQVEELRRRLDDQPQRVQVIDLSDHGTVADVLPGGDSDGDEPVVYRPGMTMAEVEKAAIEAALREYRGNRRKAAEVLGIGERTLYRKIKAYRLE